MQNAPKLPQIPRQIHYVAVDFEKDDVADALLGAGFDSKAPAVFIWEGVTMYLPRTRFARPFFSVIGEPLRSSFSKDEMRELFAAHGFEIEADDGDQEWGERYVGEKPIFDMSERLVAARRLSDQK